MMVKSPMKKFDVVFLLLSTVVSRRFDVMLNLYEELLSIGVSASIATHPSDLDRGFGRLRMVIVDGNDKAMGVNSLEAIRYLHKRHGSNQCIVCVADNQSDAFERGRDAGADICVHTDIQGVMLASILNRLAYKHEQALLTASAESYFMSADTETGRQVQTGNKPMTRSHAAPPESGRSAIAMYRERARHRKEARRLKSSF